MNYDQADDLRQMVLTYRAEEGDPTARLPAVIVAGGKRGVGTTSVAIQLATSLCDKEAKVSLIDADLCQADVTKLFGLHARQNIHDVAAGRATIMETVVRKDSLQIVPGAPTFDQSLDARYIAPRLRAAVHQLEQISDWIVIDAGNSPSIIADELARRALHLLLVTVTDEIAVLDTYAALKQTASQNAEFVPAVSLLVNRADQRESAAIHCRIAHAAQQLLQIPVKFAGNIEQNDQEPAQDRRYRMSAVQAFSEKLVNQHSDRNGIQLQYEFNR